MLSPQNARRGRSPTTALRPFCLSILAAAVTFSLAATPAFAQLEGPAVSTGYDYGTQVAYNPATHFAYVSNWDDDGATSITQIDTITGVGTTIALCSGASAPRWSSQGRRPPSRSSPRSRFGESRVRRLRRRSVRWWSSRSRSAWRCSRSARPGTEAQRGRAL